MSKPSVRDEMMVATDTATVEIEGVPYFLKRDVTRYRADHQVVKEAPHLFKPIAASYPDVEQATAVPGEKRGQGA